MQLPLNFAALVFSPIKLPVEVTPFSLVDQQMVHWRKAMLCARFLKHIIKVSRALIVSNDALSVSDPFGSNSGSC